MIPSFTTVVGVDRRHLEELSHTWPTWRKNKPGLLEQPMAIFRDQSQVSYDDVRAVVDHPDLKVYAWPLGDIVYSGTPGDKWDDPQRRKMLAGFVHIPAMFVKTPYWLKLDTDCVAETGKPDWINPSWFDDEPAIIAHKWSFTKPPDQMLLLDRWADGNPIFQNTKPLDLFPKPGSERLSHKRIISWCGFFKTDFSKLCSKACMGFDIPCCSQDGFMFYVAARLGLGIKRTGMKSVGWQHWGSLANVKGKSAEAMV